MGVAFLGRGSRKRLEKAFNNPCESCQEIVSGVTKLTNTPKLQLLLPRHGNLDENRFNPTCLEHHEHLMPCLKALKAEPELQTPKKAQMKLKPY